MIKYGHKKPEIIWCSSLAALGIAAALARCRRLIWRARSTWYFGAQVQVGSLMVHLAWCALVVTLKLSCLLLWLIMVQNCQCALKFAHVWHINVSRGLAWRSACNPSAQPMCCTSKFMPCYRHQKNAVKGCTAYFMSVSTFRPVLARYVSILSMLREKQATCTVRSVSNTNKTFLYTSRYHIFLYTLHLRLQPGDKYLVLFRRVERGPTAKVTIMVEALSH